MEITALGYPLIINCCMMITSVPIGNIDSILKTNFSLKDIS